MDNRNECGVQVVRVQVKDEEHPYYLDEEALREVLLQEGVADCPVALVSVAGVFRGGKSFLLSIFLRYLHAKPCARADGSWLYRDAENETLEGFHWRGGSEPHTSGLVLWSHPVRIELSPGNQVAVVLMDTQGTFDCHSTVRDCSTIFALSTLLSSVQIYNLKEHIKSDDLQNLQLFTEYGRMVLASNNNSSRPFQRLKFLIRDWPDKPYGSDAGRHRLDVLFQDCELTAELQGIIQHILECFESVDCFLMPHPGTNCRKKEFKGRLLDTEKDFQEMLLELVPSIFNPVNLKVKSINGAPVTGRELYEYFTAYMTVFNSNSLPETVSIMEATLRVELATGSQRARAAYAQAMDTRRRGAARAGLLRHHARARDGALRAAAQGRTMASGDRKTAWLRELEQELEDSFQHYQLLNESEVKQVTDDAKTKYDNIVLGTNIDKQVCMHPLDLQEAHRRGLETATVAFDNSREPEPADEYDSDRSDFIKVLENRYAVVCSFNQRNNDAAVAEACAKYYDTMLQDCELEPCYTKQDFIEKHRHARSLADDVFKSRRYPYVEFYEDSYKANLISATDTQFSTFQSKNDSNNRAAITAAMGKYNDIMTSICALNLPCFHPDDLAEEHVTAKAVVIRTFYSWRIFGETAGGDREVDSYMEDLLEQLRVRFRELENVNEVNNESALTEAYGEFCKRAHVKPMPFDSLGAIIVLPVLWPLLALFNRLRFSFGKYNEAKDAAINLFKNKRRSWRHHAKDKYLEKLNSLIIRHEN